MNANVGEKSFYHFPCYLVLAIAFEVSQFGSRITTGKTLICRSISVHRCLFGSVLHNAGGRWDSSLLYGACSRPVQ